MLPSVQVAMKCIKRVASQLDALDGPIKNQTEFFLLQGADRYGAEWKGGLELST
ncbi:hypothetical protein HanXRQr2_Chr07g0292751 [Helianthus annuus]|uniref:Uncharacterized protein n=1 Tax=Helianthus annuus TaxID=4232 RepID=A0A9K3NG03_HELAN|nr:hypothetical protein HanXRQr2_Chr07g0292751 [Helianthus annuus]KAJ0904548.1 hypothetical protein HanPSC8_Chr07g0283511 [Helianthus annuus]